MGERVVQRLARRPVSTARLVFRLLRGDPWWTLMKVLSVLPRGASRTIGHVLLALGHLGRGQALEAMGTWATRGADAAAAVLERRDEEGGLRPSEAAVAVEVGRPELLLDLLDEVERPSSATGKAMLRALRGAGRLDELAPRAAAWGLGHDPGIARLLDDASQRLDMLEGPSLRPPATLPPPARDGHVLHLLNNSLPHLVSGYTRRSHAVLQAQRRSGLDVVAATKIGFPLSHGVTNAPVVDRHDGVDYRRLVDPEPAHQHQVDRLQRQVDALAPLLHEVRPSVLHTTTPHDNATCVATLASWAGVPWAYEVRGFLEETWLSRRPEGAADTVHYRASRRREAEVARSASAVVTLGDAMRDDLVARGVPYDHITVVPNAVDASVMRPTGRGPAFRSAHGLPASAWTIGYVSSLVDYEGVEVLLEGTRLLRDAGHDARCLVVGDGPARPRLERVARELGGAGWAVFTGRVAPRDVGAAYEAIDLFVVPRRDQRVCRTVTPLKPVEALAMQRPLLMSDLPALRELEAAGTVAYFRPEDPAALASAALSHHPDTAALASGREWVVHNRSWEASGRAYARLYAELAGVTVPDQR